MYGSLNKVDNQHDSDTSCYASALDISSPNYHEREAIRWNSAFQLYMNMSQGQRAARKLILAAGEEDNGGGGSGAASAGVLSPDEYRPGHRRDSASLRKSISLTDGESRISPPSMHRKICKDLQHPTTLPVATAETSSTPAPSTAPVCPQIVQTPDEDDDPCFPTENVVKSDAVDDDGLSVPPMQCEWRNIHSYNTLYKPDVYPFMTSLPSGRYGFMTPPVRSLTNYAMSGASPRAASSNLVSPTESSLNSLELEAIAAVHELQFVVKDIFVSELLPRTSELIFLNLTTLEGQAYCIELTVKGWRVTSLRHDCMNGDYTHIDLHTCYFETIYSLMDNISNAYKHKFHEALSLRLMQLAVENLREEEDPSSKSEENVDEKMHFERNNDVRFSVGVDDA